MPTLLRRSLPAVAPVARRTRRSLRQALLARRRLVTAALVAAAVAAALQVLAPEPPPTVAVPVAAADLAAGHRLTGSDIRLARWPAELTPSGLGGHLPGSTLAAPVRRGEPITDARLRGAGLLLEQPEGTGSMAVWLSEPTGGLVGAGDRVDVLAGPPTGGLAEQTPGALASVVAESVLVLATGGSSPSGGSSGSVDGLFSDGSGQSAGEAGSFGSAGELLVLAVDTATALRLRAVSGVRSLSVVVRSHP